MTRFDECAVSLRIDWLRHGQRQRQRAPATEEDRTIHALYRLAVQRAPDGVAVHPMGQIDYLEVDDGAWCVRGVFPAFRAEGQE